MRHTPFLPVDTSLPLITSKTRRAAVVHWTWRPASVRFGSAERFLAFAFKDFGGEPIRRWATDGDAAG